MQVLLVEDDVSIAEPLRSGLEREGFEVVAVTRGADALRVEGADIVLLDLGLPDMDGYDLCRRLRAKSSVPIIVVTARGEEVDRVVGLEIGADDYVVKPFGFRELLARIRAVLRRTSRLPEQTPVLRADGLELDRRTRRVTLDGRVVPLTPKEFDLVALLMEDPDAVFPRRRILEEVWDTHWYGPTKTIDVHVASIRKKLGEGAWIETVRGIGFRLRPQR